ncbi:DUF6907 domain-containing protein [Kibdelosporangium lantanae]|uniref:DUF6907 domain-containing protein n=1 Tax=Kibdelosporangium lantanae TaxID=1497396 RepID=A0ABW3M4R9_9PSEU
MTNTKLNPAAEEGPSWLTEPCPQWCVATHREEDMVDDRLHFASWQRFIALPSAAPVMVGESQRPRMRELLVYVEQHVGHEDGPRVVITDSHSEEHERRFSLDEAIGVGVALFHGISIISDGKTSIRSLERVYKVQGE